MKKRKIFKLALTVGIITSVLLTFSFTKQKPANKEILLVEIYLAGGMTGIYIYHNDRPTEFIDMDLLSKKNIRENGELITGTLEKLYWQGWELDGTNGGDQIQRYIFTR